MSFVENQHEHDLNPPRKGYHAQHSAEIGFENGEGKPTAITAFCYPEDLAYDDRANPLNGYCEPAHGGRPTRAETMLIFADIWGEVIEWIYKPRHPRRVALRFLAMSFCTRPAMVGTKSIAVFAKANRTSKQNMHFVTAQFRRRFGDIFGGVRSELGREHMRQAAIMVHQRKASLNRDSLKH